MRWRWLLIGSLLLNAAGLALFAWRRLRPRPAEPRHYLTARATLFEGLRGGSPRVVFLGDSLVDWGEWVELLGPGTVNRGIDGATIADAMAVLETVLASRPAVLCLLIGGNDLIGGRSPEEVASGVEGIVTRARELSPSTRIVVHGLLPVRRELFAEAPSREAYRRANALIAEATGRAGQAFLDLAPALADERGELEARYTVDGLHLKGEGYLRWRDALLPLVR